MTSEPAKRFPLPTDLAVTAALALAASFAMTVPGARETPLRVVLGIPYLMLLPGYALVSALFPEAGGAPVESESADTTGSIDGFERIALSFGLSIAIVPLLGLVLSFTPWGLRLFPVVGAVSGITLLLTGIAVRRRSALDEADRYHVSVCAWIAELRGGLGDRGSRAGTALDVLLVVGILLTVVGVGYTVAAPGQGEQFTEFYLLTENESGELVADDYPTNFTQGETRTVFVGIENHEQEPVQYTVVVQLQRVKRQNGTLAVRKRSQLNRYSPTVAPNETWRAKDSITPTMTGEGLRVTYLLYKDPVPETPTVDSASQEVHIWINITAE